MLTITNEDNINMMARYPDKYFDLAIVDPPYGIDVMNSGGQPKKYGFKQWKRKDWDKSIPSTEYWENLFRVSKNQIVWGGNYFTKYLHPSQGWIFWFKQKGMTFADGELAWTSFDKATRQYDLTGMGGSGRIHPTQKPVTLYKWILEKYAKPGDKILDTHLGSGSIAIACHDYGFDLTACELDKEYYDAAMKRIAEHQKQIKLF
jgi:site-specific DNA-methyltransferase (adenine-specific)